MRLLALRADTMQAVRRLKLPCDDITPIGLWATDVHLIGVNNEQFEVLQLWNVQTEDVTPATLRELETDSTAVPTLPSAGNTASDARNPATDGSPRAPSAAQSSRSGSSSPAAPDHPAGTGAEARATSPRTAMPAEQTRGTAAPDTAAAASPSAQRGGAVSTAPTVHSAAPAAGGARAGTATETSPSPSGRGRKAAPATRAVIEERTEPRRTGPVRPVTSSPDTDTPTLAITSPADELTGSRTVEGTPARAPSDTRSAPEFESSDSPPLVLEPSIGSVARSPRTEDRASVRPLRSNSAAAQPDAGTASTSRDSGSSAGKLRMTVDGEHLYAEIKAGKIVLKDRTYDSLAHARDSIRRERNKVAVWEYFDEGVKAWRVLNRD